MKVRRLAGGDYLRCRRTSPLSGCWWPPTGKGGVPKDWSSAYASANIAAASDAEAVHIRDTIEGFMTANQIAEGQIIARILWDDIEVSTSPWEK